MNVDEAIHNVIAWLDTLSQRDADAAVNTLVERIIVILRRDPRMPRLVNEEWRLLFADIAARSRDELGELIEGKGDIDEAADAVGRALTERWTKKRSETET